MQVRTARRKTEESVPLVSKYVYLMWFIVLCDPQWFLAYTVSTAIRQAPTFFFALLAGMLVLQIPRTWFVPLGSFVLYTLVSLPFAYNRGNTLVVARALLIFYLLALGTVAYVRNVKQAVPIVSAVMLYQYLWWIAWGDASGRVIWHPNLANYDAFGPLMCMGLGSTYFYALSTRNKRERLIAFAASVGCVVGVVSSFARGAVISTGLVMLWMWFRSTRKGITTAALAVAVVAVAIAGLIISGAEGGRSETGSGFFKEMSTIGSNDATQQDRAVLWSLARRVWTEKPVFGVGAENFGPYAADHFAVGTTGGAYNDNPGILYARQLHSTYFEILCEYGSIGSLLFVWILVDFFKRNAQLRSAAFGQRWALVSGGRLDLGQLARGVETAMIGFLCTAMFYNQIFDIHWIYTLLTINGLLHTVSKPLAVRPVRSVLRRA